MATEFTGTGDPARSLALLWRTPGDSRVRPGPKPGVDVDRIVATAVEIAGTEGLSALSMRRVAAKLDVGVMTLYTYVPGKGELIDLMLDTVLGQLYPDEGAVTAADWRVRLSAVAWVNWHHYLRHPWTLQVATGRPPLGPGLMRKYELELRAVDGLGLTELQMDLLVTVVNGFTRGTASGVQERKAAQASTGITEDQWWAATAPYLVKVLDPKRYPTAARVGPVAGEQLQAAYAPEQTFTFGLERLLDGIGVLIGERPDEPAASPVP
jgi:AcrR family transcriptional regulator